MSYYSIYSKSTTASINTSVSAVVSTDTAINDFATITPVFSPVPVATKTCPTPLVEPVPIFNGVPTSILEPAEESPT